MSNVISLRGNAIEQTAPSTTSPIMFTAYERPLWYEGKTGTKFGNTGHKALVRMINDKPVCLNVVGEGYKLVQNAELFELVERQLTGSLQSTQLDNMVIKDQIAFNGAVCMREYRFPNINVPTPENNLIHFKVNVYNGFGTGSIKLLAGGEDQICTNGMVRFHGDATYAKHTKGLELARFDKVVTRAIDLFWHERSKWSMLQKTVIRDEKKVHDWLIEKFGERLGNKLFHQYNVERMSRGGNNLWALYSALTYYASHDTGEFTLRKTGNDHAAATMMKRQLEVSKHLNSAEFELLAA